MKAGHWTDRLSDYLDGDLTPGERAAADRHLARCGHCAEQLAQLRAVVALAAGERDASALPSRDLWPEIRSRLSPRSAGAIGATSGGRVVPISRPRRMVVLTVPQALAAGIALVALSTGVFSVVQGPGRQAAVEPVAHVDPVGAAMVLTAAYEGPMTELEAEYQRRRPELDPETILVVERNLALIDAAIADAQRALAADPSSGFLHNHLAETMRRRANLLRQIASI